MKKLLVVVITFTKSFERKGGITRTSDRTAFNMPMAPKKTFAFPPKYGKNSPNKITKVFRTAKEVTVIHPGSLSRDRRCQH